MTLGLTSHEQRGHMETGPRFKLSSQRLEKQGVDLAIPGLVVYHVIHYTTTTKLGKKRGLVEQGAFTPIKIGFSILHADSS